jgi:hypothetical protein
MALSHSIAAALILLCLGFPACDDQGENIVSNPFPGPEPSTYTYRAYTSAGVLAVSGSITLARTDSTTVAGSWVLNGISSTDRVGPQIGAGTLAGRIEGSKLSINLNPGWADNNVILAGSVEGEKIAGTWSWVTFAGPASSGTFEAVRKQ